MECPTNTSFQSLCDSIPLAMMQADDAGRILYCNAAWQSLVGVLVSQLPDEMWFSIVHPDDQEAIREAWEFGAANGLSWSREVRYITQGGAVNWGRVRVNPDGPMNTMVATLEDITAARANEEHLKSQALQLESARDAYEQNAVTLSTIVEDLELAKQRGEAAVRAKSEFLANMSHEIRTPMTAILGYIDIMIEENWGRPRNLEMLQVMKRNGQFLLDIINDILDLSKIEAGKMVAENIECSPVDMLTEVESLMQVRAETKNLQLRTQFLGSLPSTVVTDSTRLRQVLMNLVGNAIKFTDQGSVTISARFEPNAEEPGRGTLEFQVADTGIGMSEDKLTDIFDAFSQADASVTREFGGTGLGLTISRRLVDLLGGEISVSSEINVGSTFQFTIGVDVPETTEMVDDPAQQALVCRATHIRQVAKQSLGNKPLSGCRILVAEDGPDNQRLLSFLLRKAGAKVVIVENGKLACETQQQARNSDEPFHAILMDMQMPVLDGYRAAARLREELDPVPIIALTAHAMSGDRETCLAAGCDDYAVKPIDRDHLLTTILKLVKRRR